jgi:hypothetical protein
VPWRRQGAWASRSWAWPTALTWRPPSALAAAHRRQATRRDFPANPLKAVVVRPASGRDDGPGGQTVFVTNASVATPWPPFDDAAARRLLENGGIQDAKQPWDLGPPPPKHARAVRVPVACTRRRFAWATAAPGPCARDVLGEPVGWQRWRRQLLGQTRAQVIVLAPGDDGIVPLAEDS